MGPGDPFSSVTGYNNQRPEDVEPVPAAATEIGSESGTAAPAFGEPAPSPRRSRYVSAAPAPSGTSRWFFVVVGVVSGAFVGITQVAYGIGPALIVLVWIAIGVLLASLGHILVSGRLDFRGALKVLLRRIERH